MFSKTRLMLLCLFAVTLATVACGLAPNFKFLMAMRVIAGLASGGVVPIAFALVGDLVPVRERQVAMGRLLFAIMTGNLFGATCAGIIGDLVGWRGVFFATGILGAVVLAASRYRASAATHKAPGRFDLSTLAPNYRAIFGNPLAKICFGAVFLEAVFMYGVFPYIATMLHQAGETRASIAGIVHRRLRRRRRALRRVGVAAAAPSRRNHDDAHRRRGHGLVSCGHRRASAVAGRVRQFRAARLRLLHAARGDPDLCQRTGAGGARLGLALHSFFLLSRAGGGTGDLRRRALQHRPRPGAAVRRRGAVRRRA